MMEMSRPQSVHSAPAVLSGWHHALRQSLSSLRKKQSQDRVTCKGMVRRSVTDGDDIGHKDSGKLAGIHTKNVTPESHYNITCEFQTAYIDAVPVVEAPRAALKPLFSPPLNCKVVSPSFSTDTIGSSKRRKKKEKLLDDKHCSTTSISNLRGKPFDGIATLATEDQGEFSDDPLEIKAYFFELQRRRDNVMPSVIGLRESSRSCDSKTFFHNTAQPNSCTSPTVIVLSAPEGESSQFPPGTAGRMASSPQTDWIKLSSSNVAQQSTPNVSGLATGAKLANGPTGSYKSTNSASSLPPHHTRLTAGGQVILYRKR